MSLMIAKLGLTGGERFNQVSSGGSASSGINTGQRSSIR
jgi:hypothetical protein